MSFRFLHTADWQIGMKAAHAGRAAEKVREARLRAAARVIAIANERGVDAVILAGDTFEDSNVPRDLVRRVADILRASTAPVFVLPGNHDPLVHKGIFDHLAWQDVHPRVVVLRDRDPIAVGDADLFPCPLRRASSVEDPLADLPSPSGPRSRIRVGIAHGSLREASAPHEDIGEDFPMDREHAQRAWLDYLALGHWHSHSVHEIEGVGRVAYSGTHEPTKYGETGGCLLVTIDAPGAVPAIENVPCAEMEWRQRTETLSATGDLERIRRQIEVEPRESALRVLFDLKLEGTTSVADHERLADLESLLGTRFLHARLRRDRLRLMPEGDQWVEALPAGAPRATARALMAEAAKEGRGAQVAARALAILFEVAGESAQVILKSLKVERFGCLNPGAFIEQFGPNITVIHGPNGAGKSTLFRAVTYGLYQRHGLAAQDALAQIVPRGRDVGPRVEVTFEIEGTTWRLTKQFARKADIELSRLEKGLFVAHAQGPAAEDELRDLLGSEKNLKGLAGAQYRGIGEILLVDQGALRMPEVSERARDRLRLVIDQVGTTQGSHQLLAAVEKRYAEIFGKTGDVRERSSLSQIEEEISRLSSRKAELEAERVRADDLGNALAALENDSPANAAEEVARLGAELEAAWKLQVQVGQKRIERQGLTEKLAASIREADRLRKVVTELKDARAEHRRFSSLLAEAENRWRELDDASRRATQGHRDADSEVNRTIRLDRELAERQRSVEAAKRALEITSRIPDLDERVKAYDASSEKIRELEQTIASRKRPGTAEIARIREQVQTLRAKERDAERLDVRIRITAEAAVPIELGPERIELAARESREVVTGETLELRIPGVARIEVQAPGGIERVRLAREIDAARAAVHEIGLEFGTEDLAKLEDLAQERVQLEGDLQRLLASREGLFKNERKAKDAVAELGAARLTIAELLERHPEWKGCPPDAASLVPIEQAVLYERRHFAEAQSTREALLQSRRENAERAAEALAKHEELLGALKLDLARIQATIHQLESGEIDDAAREKRLLDVEVQKSSQERGLLECDADLDSLGDPQARVDRISKDKRDLEAARRNAEEDRVRLTERLDQIRARGIWKEIGDVAEELEARCEDFERERLAADALKLLRDVLVREQAAAVETALRPVADRVARMARFLFGAGAKATFGEDLAPRALAAEGCELPVDLLSAGTQDQLALLARMALGELYAEKCGRHAFVLDDPLVNCDRERRGKLLELFAASRALQIVIFTCSPELYRGLPADRTVTISVEDAKLRMSADAASDRRLQPA